MDSLDNLWSSFCRDFTDESLSSDGLEELVACSAATSPSNDVTAYSYHQIRAEYSSDECSLSPQGGLRPQKIQKRKKPTCPVKKKRQRHAANQRERKRMQSINDAFDGLRTHIPVTEQEKKLSKVDTLRIAINYIHELTMMIRECESVGPGYAQEQSKVIIRYPHTMQDEDTYCCYEQPASRTGLVGHSLSWSGAEQNRLGNDNKLSAKIWTPDDETDGRDAYVHQQETPSYVYNADTSWSA